MKSPASSTSDSLVVRTALLADVACVLMLGNESVATTASATVPSDNSAAALLLLPKTEPANNTTQPKSSFDLKCDR